MTPFPVVRVFGTATNESQPLPADGVCDYTFYDGLYDTGPFDTLYSPHFSAPVEHVLSHASLHSVTEYGLSFAYRNASQVARDLKIPEATISKETQNIYVSTRLLLPMRNRTVAREICEAHAGSDFTTSHAKIRVHFTPRGVMVVNLRDVFLNLASKVGGGTPF
ncbi:hypothetical protein MRX96_016229 [Rhipicephalus microplus]